MRRTAGRSCSCSRPWMRPAKTARSSTSCRVSIHRDAKCPPSSSPDRKSSTTIIYGATSRGCPSAGGLGYSIGPITKRFSSSACTRAPAATEAAPRQQADLGRRLADIAHFEDYFTRQGTVVLKFFLNVSRKEQKKRFLERLDEPDKRWKFSNADIRSVNTWATTARVRGGNPGHRVEARALVRRAGGQQVVHATRRGGGDRRSVGASRPCVPKGRCAKREGIGRRARRALETEIEQ